jgi:outer membrane protein assembly factor BamB
MQHLIQSRAGLNWIIVLICCHVVNCELSLCIAQEIELLWERKQVTDGDSGPINATDSHVVLGGLSRDTRMSRMICLRADDGEAQWTISHERLRDRDLDNPDTGIRSRPAIEPTLGQVAYYSNRGELVIADLDGRLDGDQGISDGKLGDSGDVLKIIDLVGEKHIFKRDDREFGCTLPSPVYKNGMLLSATGNGSTHNLHARRPVQIPSPSAPGVVAIPIASNQRGWDWNKGSSTIVHSACASPLVVSHDSLPSMLFLSAGNGALYAIDMESGVTIDENSSQWFWSWTTPVAGDQEFYLATDSPPGLPELRKCGVFAVKTKTSVDQKIEIRWSSFPKNYNGTYVSPVVVDDYIFVMSRTGTLSAIDQKQGNVLWQHDFPYYPSLDRAELFSIAGRLFVPVEGGLVIVIPSRNEPKFAEVSIGTTLKSGVAVVDDRFYGSDGNSVYAWRAQ